MANQVEIRCICCGCPHAFDKDEQIFMWICKDCLEKIKQESELRKASAELS